MEEKKVIDMPQRGNEEKPKKLSYEELEQVAHQLSEQTRQLYGQLQRENLNNMFRRLDYLFKVVENCHMFTQDFTEKCINEIVEVMTIPEEPTGNTKEEEEEKE